MTHKKHLLLIYPKLGFSGSLVQHLPLSVMYAAIDSLKSGFDVDIVDVRLNPQSWQENISGKIRRETVLVGISVMTGAPIRNALDISRWLKEVHPRLPIVWGGPHATFNAAEILDEPAVEFVICGYGSKPLSMLVKYLSGDQSIPRLEDIPGLSFRNSGRVLTVPPENRFEIVEFRDIPYYLVEHDLNKYGQLDSSDRIFPMYSTMGCPYQCTFCSSPAQYRNIIKKYVYLPPEDVADHIEYVRDKFGATYIYFIDDDSFVNLSHVESIIDEINRRGIQIKLGFRGARVNEIKRMRDAFLTKLANAGTNIFHIGAESGSQRMLDLMKKNCTVEDIIEINLKMARHPEIKTAFNWIVGIPGETVDDLRLTRELILRLIDDNPSAIIFIPNKYRPLPGTELYNLAAEYGYTTPETLEEWIDMEAEGDYNPPWYTKKIKKMINLMQIASYFIDDKLSKVETGDTLKYQFIRICAKIYSPFARLRYRYGITAFLFEYRLFNLATRHFRG